MSSASITHLASTTGRVLSMWLSVRYCACGQVATLLCDFPVGNGKTCDRPICPACATRPKDVAQHGRIVDTLGGGG